MQYTVQEYLDLLLKESFKHRNKIVLAFMLISLSVLLVGVKYPKQYLAESLIYVDDRNVIKPLMQGTAVGAESKDVARNAKEIILGNNLLNDVLMTAGWADEDTLPVEKDRMLEEIKSRTIISKGGVGQSIIKIEYTDQNANKAYLTTKSMAEHFVEVGKSNRIEESRSAYDFIEKQAAEYLEKLTLVDKKIKEFLDENPGARPGTQEKVNQRISNLQLRFEDTTLALREAEIKKASLQRQLSGEAAMTISQSREGEYRRKITEMQEQLETLLLTYTDTYPDVIRLRRQIEDMKFNLSEEIRLRDEAIKDAKKEGKTYMDASIATNPMYQELRSSLSENETEIATLETRIVEIKALLDAEYDRMRTIQEGDAMMQALTRDYEVNQQIYQDLLKKRENARISRSLDTQQRGSTFNILEPAKLPSRPFGIRFLHFIILGLAAGILLPLGAILLLIQLDGRIRSARYVSEELGVPVLSEVPHYWKHAEKVAVKKNFRLLTVLVVFILLIYIAVSGLKVTGNL